MTATEYLRQLRASEEDKAGLLNWEAKDLRKDVSASRSILAT
jgi:hypothetical protein